MSELADEYRLDYFEEEGFTRSQCDSCGDWFWSRDPDRETCGEPPCAEYAFIDDPGFDESYTLEEMREEFLSYFESVDHERIPPRPVAANRWRDDVLLTQASIYGFQPHVTSGRTPPPANPLAVSQPCIRMNDIDNVGKTGRHTMAFEMMGHHAFNADEGTDYAYEGEVYWKDRCVELCEGFFERFGVDLTELTFIEDPWVGGGNAGPAFEVIYKGAELATLVFMSMEVDPDGDYELKDGNTYSFMDRRVIDTGYGLERWTWMSQGTPTVYEAIYPETIAFLKENVGIEHTDEEAELIHEASKLAGKLDIDDAESFAAARAEIAAELDADPDRLTELLEPLEGIYAIADHCRTLAYMLGDEIVPSSAGTGYLARKVLRRTKRIADEIGVDAPLDELVDMQAERLGYQNRDTIRDMVRTEVRSYRETLQRGRRRVRELARETDDGFPTEELIELYNSHGIQPETVAEIAAEEGTAVDVPDDFYGMVAQRHEAAETAIEPTETDERLADLPETEKRYYEDQDRTEFEAVVLDTFERENGYDVVLDGTLFYPEGGGQPADHGTLSTAETSVRVTDVQDHGGRVVHHTDGDLDTGSIVRGQIDAERRRQLMQHHTATHVIGHAAREVLGGHIRQAGAQKGTESARLDVSHYDRITREEREEIELVANRLVRENLQVQAERRDRNEAEAEYGFDLYQGGVPPGETIRTITVGPDTQACGGTHVSHTGEIGTIKLLNTEPVQDGVERLTFAAGAAAIEATHETERALESAADTLDVEPTDVPETAKRFFEEWKDRGKEIDRLKKEVASARAAADDAATEIAGTPAVIRRDDTDADELRATANAIVADGRIAVLGSGAGGSANFVVGVPDGVPVDAGEVVAELARRVGGGGGGPPDFAQGGGPDADALEDALDEADEVLASVAEAR